MNQKWKIYSWFQKSDFLMLITAIEFLYPNWSGISYVEKTETTISESRALKTIENEK